MKRCGQVSMEYLIVMGFVFAMLVPLTIIYMQQSEGLEETVAISTASKISKEIIDTAEEMYYKGPPSKTTIKVTFPKRITHANIYSKEITFNVTGDKRSNLIAYPSEVNLSGSLKIFSGVHNIEIESKGDYVLIVDK